MSNKSKDDLKRELSAESYYVTQESGTERPFTGQYWDHNEDGTYKCICCGEILFQSKAKFDAGCGWPSFFEASQSKKINEPVVRIGKIIRGNELEIIGTLNID